MTEKSYELSCEELNLAIKHRHERQFDEAARLCRLALEHLPAGYRRREAGINGELGFIERKRGHLEAAEEFSRTATTLSPRSELASIGMFHTLWDQKKRKEALEEVVRLVSMRDSDHYSELLSHGFRDDLGVELLALADRARAILSGYVHENK